MRRETEALSGLPRGLANGGIAQGALMILYCTGLGPATLVSISAYPLPATLSPGNQREVARYVATGSDYRKL